MLVKAVWWCALLAAAVVAERYTTRYDDVDLDEVLSSERLLTGYVRCLMGEGACTADATELKRNLPDAIKDGCSKCSEKQRTGSAKVMHYIIDRRPDDWTRLETIYDVDGTYRKAYLESKGGSNEKIDGVKSESATEKDVENSTSSDVD